MQVGSGQLQVPVHETANSGREGCSCSDHGVVCVYTCRTYFTAPAATSWDDYCRLISTISGQQDVAATRHVWSGVLLEEGALATCPYNIRRNVDLVPPGTRAAPKKATSAADCCSQADGLGAVAW